MLKSRSDPKEVIKRMSRKAQTLKRRVNQLEQQYRTLAIQHDVLACCCDMLHWLRSSAVHSGWMDVIDDWMPEELLLLEELQAHPIRLAAVSKTGWPTATGPQYDMGIVGNIPHQPLQQQQHKQPVQQLQQGQQQRYWRVLPNSTAASAQSSTGIQPAGAAAAAADALATAAESLSACLPWDPSDLTQLLVVSPGDYLGTFRYAMLRPPYPGAASMTLEQVVDKYTALVKEFSLQLSLLEQQQERGHKAFEDGRHPAVVIREVLLEYCRMIASILLLHPDDILNKFRLVNANTMQLTDDPEEAWRRMTWIVEKLDLRDEQRLMISVGCGVFKRLVSSIQEERQRLALRQQELLQLKDRRRPGGSVDLQQQERCAERLLLLVKKERFLMTAASSFVNSILTGVQVARTAVLSWPWSPHLAMLGAVVTKQLEEQQQQQQQQKGARQGKHEPLQHEHEDDSDG